MLTKQVVPRRSASRATRRSTQLTLRRRLYLRLDAITRPSRSATVATRPYEQSHRLCQHERIRAKRTAATRPGAYATNPFALRHYMCTSPEVDLLAAPLVGAERSADVPDEASSRPDWKRRKSTEASYSTGRRNIHTSTVPALLNGDWALLARARDRTHKRVLNPGKTLDKSRAGPGSPRSAQV